MESGESYKKIRRENNEEETRRKTQGEGRK